MGLLSALFGGGRDEEARVRLRDVKDQSSAWDFFVHQWDEPKELRRARETLKDHWVSDMWGKDPWGW